MTQYDRLALRVTDLNNELDRLKRENERLKRSNSGLKSKKDMAPKGAMSLDRQSARRITSDTAIPSALAGGTVYIWLKILADVNARSFMGLSTAGFWSDPEILNWVTAGMTVLYATGHKFVRKF